MLSVSVVFAFLCIAYLAVFYTGLPRLRSCSIKEAISNSGTSSKIIPRIIVILTIPVYFLLAFHNLGNRNSPETFVPMEGQTVLLDFGTNRDLSKFVLFPGVGTGEYLIEYSENADGWFSGSDFSQDHVSVLKWQYIDLQLPTPVRFLRLVCSSGSPWLGEISVLDSEGKQVIAECSIAQLCDEPDTVPDASTFLNSSYFDEIYHARTAWEHLNGIWPYEISHPPLGKELLALGIRAWGMNPFGWRFSGTITGILMIPLMFLFLKRIFHSEGISACGTLLLASGFMHYVQTRIATIDSYAVFFILLMYYFMAGWFLNGKTKDLALCGIFFGFGAACKWTCLYAGAGLALLWILHWLFEFRGSSHYDGMVTDFDVCIGERPIIQRQDHYKETFFRFLKNAGFCVVFFLVIPCIIYYLSYYPYGQAQHAGLFSREYNRIVLDNQSFMFHYHATIEAEHPYSSRWYQWLLDIRPILYYLEYLPSDRRISIAAFVNPLICWGGLLAVPVLVYAIFKEHEKTAIFILAGYLSGLVPWFFISRLTFEYHYFASAVFLIPMICYVFCLIRKYNYGEKWFIGSFLAGSILLFFLFYPVLNGLPVGSQFSSRFLCWLPSWPI